MMRFHLTVVNVYIGFTFMADFSQFGACIDAVRQGADQEKISQATQYIKNQLEPAQGYCDFMIQFLQGAIGRNDSFAVLFTLTQILNILKARWESCGELFVDKEAIRAYLVELLATPLCGDARVLNLVVAAITIIAASDYPSRWRGLMPALTERLDKAAQEGNGPAMMVILYTVSEIFKRYERSFEDTAMKELTISLDFWDKRIVDLICEVLPSMMNVGSIDPVVKEQCLNYTLKMFYALSMHDLPDRFLVALPMLLTRFGQFLQMEGMETVKTTVCMILKQYIIRYITEIASWGTTETNMQEEPAVAHMKEVWALVLAQLMNVLGSSNPSGVLVNAVFDALTALSRSRDREFFVQGDNLLKLCSSVLIPAIQITPADEEDFQECPLDYFKRDIECIDNDGRNRQVAYRFLKALCRYFREQLTTVFSNWTAQLIKEYQANPAANWRQMDTAIFIMGALAAQVQFEGRGVRHLAQGVDLSGFICQMIMPQLQLSNQFYVLQTDALKFLVDFRAVMPREILVQCWPVVTQLVNSPQVAVVLYAYYCIDCMCDVPEFQELPQLLAQSDVPNLVTRLFTTFKLGDQYNRPSAKCLLRLVTVGGQAILPAIPGIVRTCVDYLGKLAGSANQDAEFIHTLFEIIAAAVTQTTCPVVEVEPQVLELMVNILTNEVTEFMGYTFQIIACYLRAYPDGAQINGFYGERYPAFLAPELWFSLGNIPGLAMLLTSYCIKLPQLVAGSFEQIAIICQKLLPGTRSHQHALTILSSMIRFLPPELLGPLLPGIFQLVTVPDLRQTIKYQPNFAMFISNACFFIGPDHVVSQLPDTNAVVEYWSEGLSFVYLRRELECALAGSLKALCECTVFSKEQWAVLFRGVVMMMEAPNRDRFRQDVAYMRAEEKDAMQFDIAFSKLRYSEGQEMNPHPELKDVDLIKHMAVTLAQYSHAHPGVIPTVAKEVLPPSIQQTIERYPAQYGVTFA